MSIEFSFDGIMYRQTEGVSEGSVLGSALANIFEGFHEKGLLSGLEKQEVYIFRRGAADRSVESLRFQVSIVRR